MNRSVRDHFERALSGAKAAAGEGRYADAWPLLERAHVLGQAHAGPHVRAHWAMLGCGLRQRNAREIVGQIVRLLVAAPASLAGVLPVGNTGGSDVPMTEPMPIADDLRAILAGEETLNLPSNAGKPHAPEGGAR
jgi:Protein of unknown function (DUF3703)